jgi:hypothetical protein
MLSVYQTLTEDHQGKKADKRAFCLRLSPLRTKTKS